jgi:hypothetical protein
MSNTWLLDKEMVAQAEQYEKLYPNLDHGARVSLATEALLQHSEAFDKLARYESRLERTRKDPPRESAENVNPLLILAMPYAQR